MILSGEVPAAIHDALHDHMREILGGTSVSSINLWAVHPGGRAVLDAVARAFDLAPPALSASRDILRSYGNMSSATVMFVIKNPLRSNTRGQKGCGMSFGPELTAETLLFRTAA
jgi:predicted naringenin-chalcone synthase